MEKFECWQRPPLGRQHDEARAYYALCDKARKLGIPTSLDDPRTPKTVAALEEAVAQRGR